MRETLRQYYLDQLGIIGYRSRWPLPGAAPSLPQLLVDGEESAEELADKVPGRGNDGGNQNPLKKPVLQNTAPQDKSLTADAAATGQKSRADSGARDALGDFDLDAQPRGARRTHSPSADATPVARFGYQLAVWRLAEKILFVDSAQPKLALPTQQLLNNIAVALGYKVDDLSAPESLRWPLQAVAAATLDAQQQLQAEGRAMLQAFYEAQVSKYGLNTVVLMGEPAITYSLSDEELATQAVTTLYGQHVPLQHLPLKKLAGENAIIAVPVPSLVEMLQQPQTKKITWQAIRSLHR